jgi:hypothetical protein
VTRAPVVDRLAYIKRLLDGNLHVPSADVRWLVREIEQLDQVNAGLNLLVKESCGCVGSWML